MIDEDNDDDDEAYVDKVFDFSILTHGRPEELQQEEKQKPPS